MRPRPNGWKNFIAYNLVGQRFHGVGLGPDTAGVRIDLYDSSGDYEASGIDDRVAVPCGQAADFRDPAVTWSDGH